MADVEQSEARQVKPDVKLGDNTTLPEADPSAVESEHCLKKKQDMHRSNLSTYLVNVSRTTTVCTAPDSTVAKA